MRFVGVKLGEWGHSTGMQVGVFQVFRTRLGKLAVHTERSPDVKSSGGWKDHLGLGEQSRGVGVNEAALEVFDSLEALREKLPPELFDMVARTAGHPEVENLDI